MFKEMTIIKKVFLQLFGDIKIVDTWGYPCLLCNLLVPNIYEHQYITKHTSYGQFIQNREYYHYFDIQRSIIFSFIGIIVTPAIVLGILPAIITGYVYEPDISFLILLTHFYAWYFLNYIYGIFIGLLGKRIFFKYISVNPAIRKRTNPILCNKLTGDQFFIGCIGIIFVLLITYVILLNPFLNLSSADTITYFTNLVHTNLYIDILEILLALSMIGLFLVLLMPKYNE